MIRSIGSVIDWLKDFIRKIDVKESCAASSLLSTASTCSYGRLAFELEAARISANTAIILALTMVYSVGVRSVSGLDGGSSVVDSSKSSSKRLRGGSVSKNC